MCLYASHREPKVAEQDIEVYKVAIYSDVSKTYHTPYRGYAMDSGDDVTTEIQDEATVIGYYQLDWYRHFEVNQGFHTLANLRPAYEEAEMHKLNCRDNNPTVFHAIIPKGTRYYEGEYGGMISYASERLIIGSVVDFSEIEEVMS